MWTDAEAIGAIRLALEGAATPDAAVEVVRHILDRAPATEGDDTGSLKLLLEAIKESDARLEVPA